jgi:hypothetical protein
MASLYDLDLLHRLGEDSGDAPLGSPALRPSEVEAAWARTLLATAGLVPWGNRTAAGAWPDSLRFSFGGARVGGALTGLASWVDLDGDGDGSPCELCQDDGGACFDLCLYPTGKATLAAAVMRAADSTGDPALRVLGEDLTRYALAAAQADLQPLDKLTGEYLSRLHAAVARLATAAAAPGADFHTLVPCRALDTRSTGPRLASGQARRVALAGICGVPPDARAVAVNLTVVGASAGGHLTLYPSGGAPPATSAINFAAGQTRANNAILALGGGSLEAVATVGGGGVDLIVDVYGYFR